MNGRKLYRITFTRQDSGNEQQDYVIASDMAEVEKAYADIVKIEPLHVEAL